MTHLVFGCGYLGHRVATRWVAQGKTVAVVTRNDNKAGEFQRDGFEPIVADIAEPETLKNLTGLSNVETVLFSVGFDRAGEQSIAEVYVEGMRNVLAALPAAVRHFIYISTTGVYGETDGDIVDESSPCTPTRAGGKASLAAEQQLAKFAEQVSHDFQPVVLRMAGLYGPGRVPLQSKLSLGEPLPTSPEGTINLIHIDDAAEIVVAAATVENPSQLYVVSDGHPVMRRDFYGEVARLIGSGPPQFAPPDSNDGSRRASGRGKKVNNARLLGELPVELTYPTYREGLAAILAPRS